MDDLSKNKKKIHVPIYLNLQKKKGKNQISYLISIYTVHEIHMNERTTTRIHYIEKNNYKIKCILISCNMKTTYNIVFTLINI